MKQFINKVALITGATSGIGRATAIAFAKEGAKVVVVGRNKENGQNTLKQINELGGEGIFIPADIRQENEVCNIMKQLIEKYGKLDFAFNNAGVGNTASFVDETVDDYNVIMDTNVKGTFLCMKYELSHMIKNKSGVIVNNSSASSLLTIPQHALYNASKHAVLSLTDSGAIEGAPHNVRVNAVCPIAIAGRLVDDFLQKTGMQEEDITPPLGRMGTPEDIAQIVLFLCSDAASYITGNKIIPDGGLMVKRF